MISDDPDEDADTLDDGAVFDIYLGDAPTRQDIAASGAATLPDWPQAVRDIGLNLDTETLAWFKAANTDWRSAMRSVPTSLGGREHGGWADQDTVRNRR